ncbi:MAG: OmpA family protein [Elusimicrobia bacterium]|nr:OmpA family protein [Elusimicrobiota bacterium]
MYKKRNYHLYFLTVIVFACACFGTRRSAADIEEARRARLELQSIMDMVFSKQIPPIEFESGSDKLLPDSFRTLDMVAEVLLKHRTLKLSLEGHTDDVGGEVYNEKLSFMRAGAVKSYLVLKGVYPDFIRIRGYGKGRLLFTDTSDKARALNRRVEFTITTRDWEAIY